MKTVAGNVAGSALACIERRRVPRDHAACAEPTDFSC
jgi:hypothetical protein